MAVMTKKEKKKIIDFANENLDRLGKMGLDPGLAVRAGEYLLAELYDQSTKINPEYKKYQAFVCKVELN